MSLARRASAEAAGTALLAAVVVGSSLMAQQLFPGQPGAALLAHSLATGGGLYALILAFGPLSGAHFNPAVTLADALAKARPWREVPAYLGGQVLGGLLGILSAHAMFAQPLLQASAQARRGGALLFSEALGTFALLLVILRTGRACPGRTPLAVAAVVGAGYWFTASTFFTNPALTLARAFTASPAGIRLGDVPPFVLAQLAGMGLAFVAHRFWEEG